MRSLPAALCVASLTVAASQSRPDFSGAWSMDPVRSESTRQGELVKPVRTLDSMIDRR